MALKVNFHYWGESLKHPEPIFDDYYIFDDIVVDDKRLLDQIERLRNLIKKYCNSRRNGQIPDQEIFDEIYHIITTVNDIQYNEFNAFWNALDMTYTVFKGLSEDVKKDTTKLILEKYCEKRQALYDELGYSNIIVQALRDISSSRKKGSAAINKLIDICKQYIGNLERASSVNEFKRKQVCYILPDNGDDQLFYEVLREYSLVYQYGEKNQNKRPDFLLKHFDKIFIIEAKHLKEGGGEQNKSVGELIDFVRQKNSLKEIHYVAFMDGVYFNLFIHHNKPKKNRPYKIIQQKGDIMDALKLNPNNYFVNTYGLTLLLKDLRAIIV